MPAHPGAAGIGKDSHRRRGDTRARRAETRTDRCHGDLAQRYSHVARQGRRACTRIWAESPHAPSAILRRLGNRWDPTGADVSALDHLLDGDVTSAAERGVLVDLTWRM